MSSPAKKRKLNNGNKSAAAQPKGLEYFFSKQRQNESAAPSSSAGDASSGQADSLTDEELARKLQAEWDNEVASESKDAPQSTGDEVNGEGLGVLSQGAGPDVPKPLPSDTTVSTEPNGMSKTTLTLQSTGMAEDAVTSSIPFDESPLIFEPSKYVSQLRKHWASEGGHASYGLLTRCFVLVSATASRIKIVDTLVNCLRVLIEGDPDSLLPAVSVSLQFGKSANENRCGSLQTPYRRHTYP